MGNTNQSEQNQNQSTEFELPPGAPRALRFVIIRAGRIVAQGTSYPFPNGKVTIALLGERSTIEVHDSIEAASEISGRIEWLDTPPGFDTETEADPIEARKQRSRDRMPGEFSEPNNQLRKQEQR